MTNSTDQKKLLGQFVRAHRERMTPDQPTGRRRTPGLRREELADRAGIGATWCAWIEQGRDVNASAHTLSRLADALLLTRAERAYMFELAERRDPDLAEDNTPAAEAPDSIRLLVDGLPGPAYGLDRLWNACCWNGAAADLFTGWLEPGAQKNLLRYMFQSPAARDLLPDWEGRARRLLAEFRADFGRRTHDPATQELIDRLSAESGIFAEAWKSQDVAEREGGLRQFHLAGKGLQSFRQFTYSPSDRSDFKIVVLEPVA